jgi:hypothetical protein
VTTIFPVMCGWIAQKYSIVPAVEILEATYSPEANLSHLADRKPRGDFYPRKQAEFLPVPRS